MMPLLATTCNGCIRSSTTRHLLTCTHTFYVYTLPHAYVANFCTVWWFLSAVVYNFIAIVFHVCVGRSYIL